MPLSRRNRSGPRQGCLLAGVFLGLISSAVAQERPIVPAPRIEARIDDGLLTLDAGGAPLADVLRAIGAAAAFEVILRGDLGEPVSASFSDRPLRPAIRELVGEHALIIRGRSGQEPATRAVAAIRVIENRRAAQVEGAEAAPQSALEDDEEEKAGEPAMDRETFRRASLGQRPPTADDIRLELEQPDQAARVAAVPKVGSLGARAAIGILSDVLAREDDPLVRSRAVAALGRLEGAGARLLLRERALRDDDRLLRMQALNALAAAAGDRSATVLVRALRQDPDAQVRITAIRALQRVGGGWAQRYLERAVRDPDPKIGLAAEQALATWPERLD